ncbi:hypothetical protein CYMTET_29505, partial [Cymbomonas tetramitiformis]
DAGMLSEDETSSNIHAVPMHMVCFKRMARVLKHYRGKYDTVVGIRPTGWTQSRDHKAAHGRKRYQGSMVLHEVPYSEHSGYDELKEFIKWLNPTKIIPHVDNDGGERRDQMIAMLTQNHPVVAT